MRVLAVHLALWFLTSRAGLGKTIQVISFFAYLKERGKYGPHLIIVPSSTLENWVRELDRFAPEIKVQTYYGNQKDRTDLRATLVDKADKPMGWEVLVTTYNLAQSSDLDRKFLRRIDWDVRVASLARLVGGTLTCDADMRVRRGPRPQKLPVAAVQQFDEDSLEMAPAAHRHAAAK